MKGLIPEQMNKYICVIPDAVRLSGGCNKNSQKYIDLFATLENLDNEKCVVFAKPEFQSLYGKHGDQYIRARAAKLKMKLKIIEWNGNVYVTRNKV